MSRDPADEHSPFPTYVPGERGYSSPVANVPAGQGLVECFPAEDHSGSLGRRRNAHD